MGIVNRIRGTVDFLLGKVPSDETKILNVLYAERQAAEDHWLTLTEVGEKAGLLAGPATVILLRLKRRGFVADREIVTVGGRTRIAYRLTDKGRIMMRRELQNRT